MKVGKTQNLIESKCLSCGTILDSANAVYDDHDAITSPGDFTICIKCGHLMAFNENMQLRNLTDEEVVMVAGDQRILAIQQARTKIKK